MSNTEITRSRPTMWDQNDMFKVIRNMCELPKQYDGLRRAGSPADAPVRAYLEQELKDIGLQEVVQKEVPFIKEQYTDWALTVNGDSVPCYFLRGGKFTGAEGVTGELLYVGTSVKGHDVRGKIVLLEMATQMLDFDVLINTAEFVWDPTESLKGCKRASANMPANWPTEYYDAAAAGAAGILVILPFETGTNRCYPDVSLRVEQKLPGLYLGRDDGAALVRKVQSASEPLHAHILLQGANEPARSANVIGMLKGQTDDAIIIASHTDSSFCGAVQDATGVSIVLALAAYYAQVPDYYRQKDLYFVLDANHYEWNYPQGAWALFDQFPHLRERTCLGMFIEHVGLDCKAVNDRYEPVPQSQPGFLFSPSNRALQTIARQAMRTHNLDRTIIPSQLMPGFPGEGRACYLSNIPTFNFITGPEYVFLEDDRPELVDKARLETVAQVYLDIIDWAMYKPRNLLTTIN